ncbi:MAG: TraB/GumN family protein [Gammaproteobacteria bacterium]
MNVCRCLTLLLFLLLGQAASGIPLWELEDTRGQVRLLGSIHFLRASDYPLPEAMEQAYNEADVLVMELDMDDLDPMQGQVIVAQLAIDPQGRDLEALLGQRDFAKAKAGAAELDIPLDMLRPFEPWFAALQITQMRLQQLGLDPNLGLEQHWSQRAREDAKPVRGLETLADQLGTLDSMPPRAQKNFLLSTIEEAGDAQILIDATLDAWRNGDLDTLERETTRSLADQPQVYQRLLVDRNQAWTVQIKELAEDGGNYLIVVGSAHLLGKDSVLVMLEEAGYPSRRLER